MMLIFHSGKNSYVRGEKKKRVETERQRAKNSSTFSYSDCNFIMSPNSRGIYHSFCKHMEQSVDLKKKKKMEGKGEIIFSFSHDLKPCSSFVLFR